MVLIQKENRANDSILLVCGMVLNNQKCGPGWIWTSSPRFRDHTLASARPSAWNSLPRASAARKNAKSLPATKNAASAKHVGLEFVELEVRYEWMIYISKTPTLANTLDEDAPQISDNKPMLGHMAISVLQTSSNSVFAKHVPTPAYLSIKPSQRTPELLLIRYK